MGWQEDVDSMIDSVTGVFGVHTITVRHRVIGNIDLLNRKAPVASEEDVIVTDAEQMPFRSFGSGMNRDEERRYHVKHATLVAGFADGWQGLNNNSQVIVEADGLRTVWNVIKAERVCEGKIWEITVRKKVGA